MTLLQKLNLDKHWYSLIIVTQIVCSLQRPIFVAFALTSLPACWKSTNVEAHCRVVATTVPRNKRRVFRYQTDDLPHSIDEELTDTLTVEASVSFAIIKEFSAKLGISYEREFKTHVNVTIPPHTSYEIYSHPTYTHHVCDIYEKKEGEPSRLIERNRDVWEPEGAEFKEVTRDL